MRSTVSRKFTKVEQQRIYYYYCGRNLQIGRAYPSILPVSIRGRRDRNPSFAVYESRHGNLRWKDFGVGGELNGSAAELVGVMEGIPWQKARDFYDRVIANSPIRDSDLRVVASKPKRVDPVVSIRNDFTESEVAYWLRFGITPNQLEANNIYACDGIQWSDGKISDMSSTNEPKFIYDLSEAGDMTSWKLYNPLTQVSRWKWKSWNLSKIPSENFFRLPEQLESLIICSSTKDRLVLNNLGYYADNPTSEGSYRKVIEQLETYNGACSNIHILFDNDNGGKVGAEKLAELTSWNILQMDWPNDCKDPAEIVETYGYNTLRILLLKALN